MRCARRRAIAVLALLAAGAARLPAAEPLTLRLSSLERTWRDTVGEIAPFRQGDLVVTLSSPTQYVTLREVTIELAPDLVDGGHRGTARVQFLGRGQLVADLAMAGAVTRMDDEVTVPLQTRSVTGRFLLAAVPGGFRITPLELPAEVEVEVRSGMAENLVGLCQGMTLLTFGALDCDRLEADLARVRVPLPPVGEPFLVPAGDLAEPERAALEAYLRESGP